jgi:hypothetical protein
MKIKTSVDEGTSALIITSKMNPPSVSKRDRTNDNFARATFRFMKRCDQLSRRYDADVYLLVRRKQRHYDYKSTDDPSFPVSSPDLVSWLNIHGYSRLQPYTHR